MATREGHRLLSLVPCQSTATMEAACLGPLPKHQLRVNARTPSACFAGDVAAVGLRDDAPGRGQIAVQAAVGVGGYSYAIESDQVRVMGAWYARGSENGAGLRIGTIGLFC